MLGFARRAERGTPVRCSFCRKLLAARLQHDLVPDPRELTELGAIPMKHVGWFCSRRCADEYELRFRVIFEPEAWGSVERRDVTQSPRPRLPHGRAGRAVAPGGESRFRR